MTTTAAFELEMMSVTTAVTHAVSAGVRSGLSKDAAALAALIGALSVIRVEGLREEALIAEAKRAVPGALPTLT